MNCPIEHFWKAWLSNTDAYNYILIRKHTWSVWSVVVDISNFGIERAHLGTERTNEISVFVSIILCPEKILIGLLVRHARSANYFVFCFFITFSWGMKWRPYLNKVIWSQSHATECKNIFVQSLLVCSCVCETWGT